MNINLIFKPTLIGFVLLFSTHLSGQIPPGYYDDTEGLTGEELRQTLHEIIDNHTVSNYSSLWWHFEVLDQKMNGKVWDIYSDQPGGVPAYQYTFGSDQCGNYNSEGDCYNREHSFPKSWFDDQYPMYTDLFHLYPTDGYVNGKRSNHPYGPVGTATWTSTNGTKVGFSNWPSYSGIVFEPIDEYKGDVARSYFYMLTRYMDQISQWESDMLSGDDFAEWAKDVLLLWASEDPVSQKEIDRNNGIYGIQDNRNPYIDQPEFAAMVWDESTGTDDLMTEDPIVWYYQHQLYFANQQRVEQVWIMNTTGQVIFEKVQPATIISLPDLPGGVYFAVARTPASSQAVKFIVQ